MQSHNRFRRKRIESITVVELCQVHLMANHSSSALLALCGAYIFHPKEYRNQMHVLQPTSDQLGKKCPTELHTFIHIKSMNSNAANKILIR